MKELNVNSLIELKPTLRRVIKIWWAYVWRYAVACAVSFVIAAVAGAVLGYSMGARGYSREVTKATAYAVGLFIGVATTIVPLKLIIGKQFKGFRLVLLKTSAASNTEPTDDMHEAMQSIERLTK